MIAESGHAALWLAAAFALLGLVSPKVAEGSEFTGLSLSVSALLVIAALIALVWCAEAADFSLILVDDHIHRLQPPLVRLAAILRAPGGWLLLTAGVVGGAAMATATAGIAAWRYAPVLLVLLAATLALDPFARQPVFAPEGRMLWVPADLGAALSAPILLALAVAALAAALAQPDWQVPPRWMVVAGALSIKLALLLGVVTWLMSIEASASLTPGGTLAVKGLTARLVETIPTAGPGYTAVEARLRVDAGGAPMMLRPQRRTAVDGTAETSVPDSARLGGGRVEAALGVGNQVTLRWRPLP